MAQNSAKGSSYITPSLDGLTDVTIAGATTNQVLTYNGSGWINSATQGDMLKSVYDSDNDGVVDSAAKEVLHVRNSTGSTIPKTTYRVYTTFPGVDFNLSNAGTNSYFRGNSLSS